MTELIPINDPYVQPLLFLREISREELKSEGKQSDSNEQSDAITEQPLDVPHFLRNQHSPNPPSRTSHCLEDIFDNFHSIVKSNAPQPRLFIEAPPGAGKSTLLKMLSVRAVERKPPFQTKNWVPLRVSLADWIQPNPLVSRTQDEESNFYSYLRHVLFGTHAFRPHLKNGPSLDFYERLFNSGRVLLLLDGVDEVAGTHVERVEKLINSLTNKNIPIVITARTFSGDHFSNLLKDKGFGFFTVKPLENNQRNEMIERHPRANMGYDPQSLIQTIDEHESLRDLTTSPLLLSLICYVTENHLSGNSQPERKQTFPITKAELYSRLISTSSFPGVVPHPCGRHIFCLELTNFRSNLNSYS